MLQQTAKMSVDGAAQLPGALNVPTMTKQDFSDRHVEGWFGFIGLKGLPTAGVKRLEKAMVAAFATPEMRNAAACQSSTIHIGTHRAATQFFRSERDKYAKRANNARFALP